LPPYGSTPADATLSGGTPAGDDVGAKIDALYKTAGISDGGRGSGFADKAYWSEHPSEVSNGRLQRDLEGTGTDQPTGTPGRGPWLNSGRNAPEAGIGQATRNANGGFWNGPGGTIAPPTGGGTSWAPGASAPTGAPTGQHWDASQARFVDDSAAPVNPTAGPLDAVLAQTPNLSLSQRQALIAYLLQQQNPTPTPPVKATVPPLVPPVTTGGGGGGQTPVDPNNPNSVLP
jgi:hypothetical protein